MMMIMMIIIIVICDDDGEGDDYDNGDVGDDSFEVDSDSDDDG